MKVSISALTTTLLYVHAPFSAYAQTLSPAPAPVLFLPLGSKALRPLY